MATIQFSTVVDQEQVIRPPDGVILPLGQIEVIVRPVQAEGPQATDSLSGTRDWLLSLAAAAEQAGSKLPADLAEHHDHYAHGKPRP